MIVYCSVEDCKHCENGKCDNMWPIGASAIRIEENYMGIPYCTDFEQREAEEKDGNRDT